MRKRAGTRWIAPILVVFLLQFQAYAQQKGPPEIPPAKVVVADISSGMAYPQTVHVGTVFYQEMSRVASEVTGLIEEVNFEEGQHVKKGQALVMLNSDLLEKTIQSAKARHEQNLSDLEKTRLDFERVDRLFKEGLSSKQEHDEHKFRVKNQEKQADSLRAELERLQAELKRKIIKAPFEGVVLEKHVNIGEWLSPGAPVATIAMSGTVDVVVHVPEDVLMAVTRGRTVRVEAGGDTYDGKIIAIIPKGDISTRTFPIKIRILNNRTLMEGMDARVTLPAGEKKKSLMAPRDAVILFRDNPVVFAVIDAKAVMIPIKVTGYDGMMAWLESPALEQGMKVVIKGNERLRDGQPVDLLVK